MIRKCDQTKCGFHTKNGGAEGCPICSECGCESNIVEDDLCVNCHCCLGDEGYIRDGLPKFVKEAMKQSNKMKEEIVEVMNNE